MHFHAYFLLELPSFSVKPRDQRMGMNGIAKFDCVASGNPPPSVFWTKEGSQDLMFTGTTHGQMQVTAEGTLMINVRTQKSICHSISSLRALLDRNSFAKLVYCNIKRCILKFIMSFPMGRL